MTANEDFQPLRRSLKRKGTETEDNFVSSYRRADADPHHRQQTDSRKGPINDSISSSSRDIDKLRFHYSIEVDDENCSNPVTTFKEANIPNDILSYLSACQIHTPTAVQMQAVPILLSGRDVVVIAPTGSGKTLGYLLPLYMFLKRKFQTSESKPGTPLALIITPTRELMQQVQETATKMFDSVKTRQSHVAHPSESVFRSQTSNTPHQQFSAAFNPVYPASNFTNTLLPQNLKPGIPPPYPNNIPYHGQSHYYQPQYQPNTNPTYVEPSHSVYGICGGVPLRAQIERLKEHIDIVVATPGRLLELSQKNLIDLSNISYLVIDECDKMLDMGLEEQLRKLIALITIRDIPRQTSLWSATLPDSLERLARSAVLNPVIMHVGLRDTVCKNISQDIIFMHSYQKPKQLLQTLRSTQFPPVLVFASSITAVDETVELLREEEFHVEGLHSHKDQEKRFQVISDFRNGNFDVLVATDLASRGLDIVDITHVINYDTPNSVEDYIHRCGRTGRFGRPGCATTFLTLDCKIANELKDLLESSGLPVPKALDDTKQFGKKVLKTEFGDRVL